jgi:excinuclease ABC subunit C
MLARTLPFDPTNPAPTLSALPEKPGIFALFGADPKAEPYLARTTNIRRRLKRFLDAKPTQTKRLRLTERVASIEYTAAGSDFESMLALYAATHQAFGERARKRLHLYAPYFLRMTVKNRYPRVYVTNTVTKSATANLYGPFPSRAAAERFCDEALNLFLLRRCYPDLDPDPASPGCVYSEMKMCLAPCFKGCTDEEYSVEVNRVQAYFDSGGESLTREFSAQRDAASANLAFEDAATIHVRLEKLKPILSQFPEIARRLDHFSALVVQPCHHVDSVTFFRMQDGAISGPAVFSIQPIEHEKSQSMESRVQTVLDAFPPTKARSALETMEHLALLKRWYYRGRRTGEIFLADDKGILPMRRIVRGIGRVLRGEGSESDLLEQSKVREGIMEFPLRKEPGNAEQQKENPDENKGHA